MIVPANCPGVLDKAAKKAFKEEARQSTPALVVSPSTDNSLSRKGSVSVNMSRSNTVTSMSSTYAGLGQPGPLRSPSKLVRTQSTTSAASELSAEEPKSATKPTFSGGASLGRNRIMAPPPAQYVKPPVELPGDTDLQKGRMLYAYSARDDGELTVSEGTEVVILEGDGKQTPYLKIIHLLTQY